MLEKNFNDYVILEDLNAMLESDTAELTKKLDSADGVYDGMVQAKILNEWRACQGLKADTFSSDIMPFIDAIKYINFSIKFIFIWYNLFCKMQDI